MKNLFLLPIIGTLSTTLTLTSTQSQINNNITIYASAKQDLTTANAVTAVQQSLPTSLLKELTHSGESFMSTNKLLIAAIAGSYAYGRTFVSIVQANHELARENAWAAWKPELSLDELKAQDTETLTKELLRDIQKRHTSAEKPGDALLPFITFLNTIDTEIAAINHYRSLNFWLESCRVKVLFPLNERRFAAASSRLERLWFIKNLFLNWAADYKLSTLSTRSTLSTLSKLYHYFADKLTFSSKENKSALFPDHKLTLNQLATDKNIRAKTMLRTVAETACCAQIAALIGAALSPITRTMTINIAL